MSGADRFKFEMSVMFIESFSDWQLVTRFRPFERSSSRHTELCVSQPTQTLIHPQSEFTFQPHSCSPVSARVPPSTVHLTHFHMSHCKSKLFPTMENSSCTSLFNLKIHFMIKQTMKVSVPWFTIA